MLYHGQYRPLILLVTAFLVIFCPRAAAVYAQGGTDFRGTVLTADPAAGKLVVKKDEGGTRFTFVVNDKTQFTGIKSLADLNKGDHVIVNYLVNGTQYVAQKVTALPNK
jgi:hypothetical protein